MRRVLLRWRRYAGLLTLVLTVFLTIGWLRSEYVYDEISFCPQDFSHIKLVSQNGGIQWHRYAVATSGPSFAKSDYPFFVSSIDNRILKISSPALHETLVWQWRWLEFGYGTSKTHLRGMTVEVWTIPYWSVVMPLILLSAVFLLLARKEKEGPPITLPAYDG